MNLKLEELRKRLLDPLPGSVPASSVYRHSSSELYPEQAQPAEEIPLSAAERESAPRQVSAPTSPIPMAAQEKPSVTTAVLDYVQQTVAGAEEEAMDANGQYQLAQAVAKVFEQTRTSQERFAELERMFEPIEQAGAAAARAIESLTTFERQLAQLAGSFEPMRAFQAQLAQLAQSFEPMRVLQRQLAQLSEAFQLHLGMLAKSLDPAREFQARLLKVTRAFDSVEDLRQRFTSLMETFKAEPIEPIGNGLGTLASTRH